MPPALPHWLPHSTAPPVAFGRQVLKLSDFQFRSHLLSSATSRWHQRAQAAPHACTEIFLLLMFLLLKSLTCLIEQKHIQKFKHLWLQTSRVSEQVHKRCFHTLWVSWGSRAFLTGQSAVDLNCLVFFYFVETIVTVIYFWQSLSQSAGCWSDAATT